MPSAPNSDDGPAIGAVLRRHRLAARLSQEALAERAGLSPQAISALESGARSAPHRDTVARLAAALRLAPAERMLLEAAADTARRRDSPSAARPRHNLPIALTSFVGRERELAEVIQALDAARLVTLTGPGGVGKTRLALVAAATLVPRYPDGVWLADLAPLADPALVPRTVAAAVGVHEPPDGDSQQAIVHALGAQRLLLVLDNCEHLLDACASLAEAVLRTCPEIRILATGREVLGMAGEVSWRVPSLATPPTDRPLSADQLARYPAVALFIERARAALPGFAPTPHEAALADVCAQLDGIPLALELAAARVAGLALPQLASRLREHFRLLTGGSRTALPRQRTLQATIDWSYDLLGDDERRLFRRLAVFVGGWTPEAAEAVAAGDGLAQEDVLDLLLRLAAKSLVVAESGRYRLLETIRQYGRDRLAESGEESVARERHAAFYLALAEEPLAEELAVQAIALGDAALGRLDAEIDNLRAALRWYADRDEEEAALRLAGALEWFWVLQGHGAEGRRWLERALARRGGADARVRAHALHAAGLAAFAGGDFPRAEALLAESVDGYRRLDDRRGLAWALHSLAIVSRDQAKYVAAIAAVEEALALGHALGDRALVGWLRLQGGIVARDQGDLDRAQALLGEALTVARARDYEVLADMAAQNLAAVAEDRGDYVSARAYLSDALAAAKRTGRIVALQPGVQS